MKQVLSGMLMVLVIGIPIISEAQLAPKPVTFHNATATASGDTANGLAIEVGQYNSVGFDVEITDTAEVTFEILAKSGGTWRAMACVLAGDTTNTLITTLSSSGSVQCNIAGMASFRVRVSSLSGGTVSASGRATIAVLARRGGSGGSGSGITAGSSFPGSPSTNQLFLITDDSAAGECDSAAGSAVTLCRYDGADWQPVNILAEADTLQTVFGRGNIITTAVSFATALKLLDENGDGYAWYVDPTNGPIFVCVDNFTEGACASYTRTLAAGQTLIYKNSGGSNIFVLTESTGAITSAIIDARDNVVTSRFYWDLDMCGVSPTDGTTVGHIWNEDPLGSTPTATAVVGTNRAYCALNFPDSDGTYGVQITRHLPDGFVAGTLSADVWWTTTGTGNARFQIATICYADDEADDAAFNTATVTTAAAGTSGRPNKQNVATIDTTGCVGGELIRIRFFRARTEASDTLNAALNVEKVFFKGWDAQ